MVTGVSDVTMNNMYNSLDVYLSNSKGEGFGIPTIEAQSAGVPVIVSNNTAQPELCGGGWILKNMRPEYDEQSSWEASADPDEIVECLEQAYEEKNNGKLAERKIAAREKALEYDIKPVMDKYWIPVLAQIEELIKRPPPVFHSIERKRSSSRKRDYRNFFIPENGCKPARVIDIGCGTDVPWKCYLEHLGEYVGIDKEAGDGLMQMDAHKLKFPDKHFGFAWCCDVLEHVADPETVMREARRVARHGVILFCTPQAREFNLDPEHKEVKLKHTLTKAGHGLITW